MPDYHIREAVYSDAARVLAHLKAIADEPDNGILYNAASEVTFTEEDEAGILQEFNQNPNKLFAIAVAQDSIIGVVNCACGTRPASKHTFGLGISINRRWRNQGVGTALMRYLIEWARSTPQCHRLELEVFTHNVRAIHVYEKVGFQREGVRHEVYFKDGRFVDALSMALFFPR